VAHSLDKVPIENFCCLYYPAEKVLAVAENKEAAKLMIDLRRRPSIRQLREFSNLNPCVLEFINFAISIVDTSIHSLVTDILQEIARALAN